MTYAIIGVGILIVTLIYITTVYNQLIELRNKVEEAYSTMDVYLKKRWDLIPNLVETVKGYTKHEKETLKDITELRAKSYSDMTEEEKLNTNAKMTQALNKLLAVSENYPDLKANENFIQLSNDLRDTEEDISNARKFYNGTCRNYNDHVMRFPSNIVASIFRFEAKKLFEISDVERENVKVEF